MIITHLNLQKQDANDDFIMMEIKSLAFKTIIYSGFTEQREQKFEQVEIWIILKKKNLSDMLTKEEDIHVQVKNIVKLIDV